MKALLPADEAERLAALHEYAVLDTLPEAAYDDLTHLASHLCGTPVALITLIDRDRQWFKSAVGLGVPETPRELAFCAHTILQQDLVVVRDALEDPRFADNPFVTEAPYVRFYAAAPLLTPDGHALGSLCVLDDHPRDLDPEQRTALLALARQAMAQLELRRHVAKLETAIAHRERAELELRKRSDQSTRYAAVLLKLAQAEETDARAALQHITRADAQALGVARVGVWLFSGDGSKLVCQDLYVAGDDRHEAGAALFSQHLPGYFHALRERRAIAAVDALADPATREFADDYLRPLGITSMLDVPIWRDGRMVGVVCHEHIGPPRDWTLDEQEFAASIADLAARAFESAERRQAEEELRERERQLSETQRLARLGSWEWDVDTGALRWSDELYRIYGWDPGAITLSHAAFMERIHPDDRDRISAVINGGYESGEPFRFEHRIIRPDGTIRRLVGQGESVRAADGRPRRMVGFAQDVTELAAAEEASRISNNRFRTMFEQFPYSIQIFDGFGSTLEVNQAWKRLFGMSPEQVRDFNPLTDPELGAVRELLQRGFAGESLTIPPHPYVPPPARNTGGDGSGAVEPIWLEVAVRPVRDEGAIREVIVVHQDVSDRERAQQQLRVKELRYRALVEASTQAVWTATGESGWDPETAAWWLEMTGQTREDAVGWGWLDALHPDDRQAARAEWERALSTRKSYQSEYRVRRRDGDYLHLDVRGVPVDHDNGAHEWVGTFTDVTDLKEAEQALRRAKSELELRVDERTAELAMMNEALEEEIAEHEAAKEALSERTCELEAIFHALPDLYFRTDRDGRILDRRGGAEWGVFLAASDLHGARVQEVFPPDTGEQLEEALGEVRATGELRCIEYDFPVRGDQHFFEARIVPIANGDLVSVIRDITERRRAEEAVRGSEVHFRRLIENAQDVITILDVTGRMIYQSPSLQRILGYLPEELEGVSAFDLVHPDDVEVTREELQKCIERPGAIGQAEYRYRHRDGSWRYLETIGRSLLPDSVEAGIVFNSRDVTQRKAVEEALRQSEEHFRAILNNASDLVTILGPDGRVLFESEAAERMFGYLPSDIVGTLPWGRVHPDDLERVQQTFRSVMESPGLSLSAEFRYRAKDGSWRTVEVVGRTLREGSASDGAVVNIRDVTERQEAEAALRSAKEQQEALLNNIPDLAWLKDAQHRILAVNEAVARAAGVPRELCPGRTDFDVWPPDVAEKIRADDERVLREGKRIITEEAYIHPDGTRHVLETVKQPFRDHVGRIAGTVGIARDITERKDAEEALRAAKDEAVRANRAKSEFLSRMSHELRTPMNSILGFAQLLARAELTPEQRKGVQHILTAGRHLLTLINEVLDIARIEAGRHSFSLEAVRIDALLQEATGLVRPLANQRGILITQAPADGEPVFVHADRQRLAQVMLNVLSNAVKYNREGGRVFLSCERITGGEPGWVRIRVEDTGRGIPAGRLTELFVPFARLGAEQSTVEGTGLGLALSRRLVEAMGGTLELESSSEVGSVFRIDLRGSRNPLDRVDSSAGSPNAVVGIPHPPAKILYVEDNLANLALVETILLDRPQWMILPALQGQIGVELAQEHAPDLILLDIHLPDISGDEVLRRIRKDSRTAEIPVIVISADATRSAVDRLRNGGADAYLSKPLDVDEFLGTVERLLRRARR